MALVCLCRGNFYWPPHTTILFCSIFLDKIVLDTLKSRYHRSAPLGITEDLTDGQRKNNLRMQEDLKARYYNAPDLEWVGKNGWRFVNAVSDFATHADPIRKTRNYNENLFLRTAEGNPMIDKAYKMVLSAA